MIPNGWLPAWAFVERDLRKYFRNPALLASSLLLPLLQLVVIGYGFGGKIRDVAVALVDLDRGPTRARRGHPSRHRYRPVLSAARATPPARDSFRRRDDHLRRPVLDREEPPDRSPGDGPAGGRAP